MQLEEEGIVTKGNVDYESVIELIINDMKMQNWNLLFDILKRNEE